MKTIKNNNIEEELTMIKIDKKHSGVFAAGVLFGTAGIKLLSSKDAKKVYTGCTAAVLRMKDCIMKIAVNVQDNCEDIYAGAVQINDDRKAAAAEYEDESATEDVELEETKSEESECGCGCSEQ